MNERAYQHLIFSLGALGNRTDALKSYEECVQHLREQLGVGSSRETIQLYQQVKSSASSRVGDKKVLAANSTLTYSRYLYPAGDPSGRDHSPFIIHFYGPVDNLEHWKVYARAIESSNVSSSDMEVQLSSSYWDLSFQKYQVILQGIVSQ